MDETTGPRQLRRSSADGVLGGVSVGLARYLNIDPVIVRIGFVVPVFFGGIGVVAYAVAWLLVPDETGSTVLGVGRSGLGRRQELTQVVGVLLVFFAASLVVGHWSGADGVFFPLVLIAAGTWLLLRPRHDQVDAATAATPGSTTTPTETPPPPAATERTRTPYTTTTIAAPAPPLPPEPKGPPVAQITFALVVLAGGAFGLAASVFSGIALETALVTCLAITGTGLVVGAFVGRSSALIPLGIVLLAALSLTSALDVDLRGGIGERRHAPATIVEIDDEYRLGMGEMVIDLRDLDAAELRGERIEIDATVAVGSLQIRVPAGVRVTGEARAQLGEVVVFGVTEEGGDPELTVDRDGDEGAGSIAIDAEVGVGEVVVR